MFLFHKKIQVVMLIGFATCLLCAFVFVQQALAVSQSGTATVTLTEGLELEEVRQLRFGKVLIPSTGTNVVFVDRTGSGEYTSGDTIGDDQQNARYKIIGFANADVDVTSSGLSAPSGSGISFDLLDHGSSRTLDGSGEAFFKIGGQITVDSSAVAGNYTLNYTITVEYN